MANELIAPGAKFYVPGQAEPMLGPSGYLAIIGMMRNGFPAIQWSLEDMVAENNKVAVRFIMQGTHQDVFFGVPATGKPIRALAMNLYRFSNNQIIEEYGQPDLVGLLHQIGAMPAL